MFVVTSILFLETLMTVFVFYAFWESATFNDSGIINPLYRGLGVSWSFVALAPISGLGKQHISSDRSAANLKK